VERRLAGELTELVRDVSIGFLAPIFFVTAGFQVTLDVFSTSLSLLLTIVIMATVGKVVGTALFYLLSGNGWREGVVIGAGMNGRGAVEIIIAEIALASGIISQEIFSVLVFMAIFTTAMVPVFLKLGTDWLKSRGELVRSTDKRTGTVIVGAGPTARALARELAPSQPVWLIDNNLDNCMRAKSEGLMSLYGDVLNEDNLEQVHISEARWFLALTSNTEINMLAAQLARNIFSVPHVFVLLTRTEKGSLRNMVSEIAAYPIYDGDLNITVWDRLIAHDNKLETVEIEVESAADVGAFMEQLRTEGKSFLPLTVDQNGQRIPFVATQTLEVGEKVTLLQQNHKSYPAPTML
jgi:Trk K+ transport system NAD-binding subunit